MSTVESCKMLLYENWRIDHENLGLHIPIEYCGAGVVRATSYMHLFDIRSAARGAYYSIMQNMQRQLFSIK